MAKKPVNALERLQECRLIPGAAQDKLDTMERLLKCANGITSTPKLNGAAKDASALLKQLPKGHPMIPQLEEMIRAGTIAPAAPMSDNELIIALGALRKTKTKALWMGIRAIVATEMTAMLKKGSTTVEDEDEEEEEPLASGK